MAYDQITTKGATSQLIEVLLRDSTHMPGLYQFGIPNAALVTGANAVTVTLTATDVIGSRVRLVLIDADLRNAATLTIPLSL